MTPQNINHLIDAITAVVCGLGISGLLIYIFVTLFKNLD